MNAANAAVIYYGAVLVENGEITVGDISAFLLYMFQLIFNFAILGMVVGNVFKIIGASEKIIKMMQLIPTVNSKGGIILPDNETIGEIELVNVNFHYPTKQDVEVAKGINLKIAKNKVVALVGQSGCGKSSIIALVQRFYDPQSGQVLFSGRDIKEFEPRWYKKQIAIVSQEPVLFSGSIRENICYGLDINVVTDADLDDACKKSNAYVFISDKTIFPDGYDTIVGERGVKLSGGQKQRVAIARALLRKPKVLLLDEATSALDAESEHQVQQALEKITAEGQQTVIVIAHRLSTIRDADMIVVLEKGEIKETGTHDELLAKDGAYKALINRQLTNQANMDNQNTSPMKKKEADFTPVKGMEDEIEEVVDGLPTDDAKAQTVP